MNDCCVELEAEVKRLKRMLGLQVKDRVLIWLVENVKPTGSVIFAQERCSEAIYSCRETVSRTLHQMRREGLITLAAARGGGTRAEVNDSGYARYQELVGA